MQIKEKSQRAFIQKVHFEKVNNVTNQIKAVKAYKNKEKIDEYLEEEGSFHLVRYLINEDKSKAFQNKDVKNVILLNFLKNLPSLEADLEEEEKFLKVELNEFQDDKIRVFQAMSKHLITVIDSTSIGNCITLINKYNIGCLPVINPKKKTLCGLITLKDIVAHLLDKGNLETFVYPDSLHVSNESKFVFFEENVDKYMKKELITVSPEEEVEIACNIMLENKVHRLLVVKEDKILGIFSTFDALKVITKYGIFEKNFEA